jgi:undecaprenyl-diphosphatase
VLATTIVASVVPHLLKSIFYQIRPDRRTLRGHLNGVPLSGKALDAFPSGHAIHVGALASAASRLQEPLRSGVWLIGGVLVATRVVLLAHWLTDVVSGLSLGFLLERGLRLVTGFGRSSRSPR